MPRERPPTTEAEFRVVHGPWPRWVLHLSLIKLAAYSAAVVGLCVVAALALLAAAGLFE